MSILPEKELACTLIPCEWKVLLCLADGCTTAEIANKLFLSIKSVYTYQNRISDKLLISGFGKLARFAWINRENLYALHQKLYPSLIVFKCYYLLKYYNKL